MYTRSFSAMFSAVRLLFKSWRVLLVLLLLWAGLLTAVYPFASTREATIGQLVLTLVVVIAAPALFFVLQALSVTYAEGGSRIRRLTIDCLRLVVVSLPVLGLTLLAVHALGKVQSHVTLVTTLRYLLIGMIAPMLTIQLWITTTNTGLRSLVTSLRSVIRKTFAPQTVFVYACGFLIFAVIPYLMVQIGPLIERPWLELSVLVVRLAASALLILLGWVTTVGAMSILNRSK